MGRKFGGSAPFLVERSWAHLRQCGLDQGPPAKCRLDPSSRLATIDMARRLERGLRPLFGQMELGPHLTQYRLDRGYLLTMWHLDLCSSLVAIMGEKLGGGLRRLFWEGETGSPSNTKSPGLRPTSIQSGILIHPAIWSQPIWAENWVLCPFGGG